MATQHWVEGRPGSLQGAASFDCHPRTTALARRHRCWPRLAPETQTWLLAKKKLRLQKLVVGALGRSIARPREIARHLEGMYADGFPVYGASAGRFPMPTSLRRCSYEAFLQKTFSEPRRRSAELGEDTRLNWECFEV